MASGRGRVSRTNPAPLGGRSRPWVGKKAQSSRAFAGQAQARNSGARDKQFGAQRRLMRYDGSPPTKTPWYGNYLGPDNNGWNRMPINSLDAAARTHDIGYDMVGASGIIGALTNTSVTGDDWKLATSAWDAFQNDSSLTPYDQAWALGTAGVMGGLAYVKEFYNTAVDYLDSAFDSVSSWMDGN
jgi:hypothetical protein